MPLPQVMMRRAKLNKPEYSYCARDPVLPLALLSMFAFDRRWQYIPLGGLKGEFRDSIEKFYTFDHGTAPDHVLRQDDEAWGPASSGSAAVSSQQQNGKRS